jgi:probable rRNA maturation factor
MSPEENCLLFRHPARGLPRAELRAFLDDVARRVAGREGIACLIADDRELRRLNRKFRGRNYAADVLSFPSIGGGDMAISLDRASAQAAEHGHSVPDEVRILMLHGALHLAGMDHETDSGEMARRERLWRRRLGLPRGLIERTRK